MAENDVFRLADAGLAPHPARLVQPNVGVRLSAIRRSSLLDADLQQLFTAHEPVDIGPSFIGQVAMASSDELVVIGHVADGLIEVWRGSAHGLTRLTQLAAPVPAGGLVSLVRYRNEWHLFARSEHGRSSHLISTDLREWAALSQLTDSFPAFAVSGAAVRNGDLLLAGRIFVDSTAFGWGLLRSDGRSFEARPVPLPLATQLGVVGPIVNGRGDTVLLLDSGHNRTVARSVGTGWSLSLLVPDVTPSAAFGDDADLWLVGDDNTTNVPSVARIDSPRVIALPPGPGPGPGDADDDAADAGGAGTRQPGRVRAAMVHDHFLILARET